MCLLLLGGELFLAPIAENPQVQLALFVGVIMMLTMFEIARSRPWNRNW